MRKSSDYTITIKHYPFADLNIIARHSTPFNTIFQYCQISAIRDGHFNLPQLIFAAFFFAPLDAEHANEIAKTDNHNFKPKGQVTNGINYYYSIETVGNRIDKCGDGFAALDGCDRLDRLNNYIDDIQNDENN